MLHVCEKFHSYSTVVLCVYGVIEQESNVFNFYEECRVITKVTTSKERVRCIIRIKESVRDHASREYGIYPNCLIDLPLVL